ncbi:unnamed protein product [Ilex paraguariensis]|uniref:Uncharacterized protein n=1 Tax=Ilex paraguariensis TaxID=185542 RepID=A0ABC8SEJ0_9AQUA
MDTADVRRKVEALDRYTLVTSLKLRFSLTDCDFYVLIFIAIMTKPKPTTPTTPESPSQTPQGSEPQPQCDENDNSNNDANESVAAGGEVPPAEPMETDKFGTTPTI